MSDSVQGRLLCGALRNPRCTIDSFVLLCLVWFCAPRPPGRGAGRRGAARRRGRGPPPVVPTAHRGAQCRRSTQWEPPAALPMSAGRVLHGLESPAAPLCLRPPAHRRRHGRGGGGCPGSVTCALARSAPAARLGGTAAVVRLAVSRRLRRGHAPAAAGAVHLFAGSTTSSFFTRIPRTILARPLVTTSVERFSCQKLVTTCIRSHPGILHRLFGCIRNVFRSAFYGVQDHGVNARMPEYAYAQQVRTSSPFPPTRWLRDFCALH